MKTALVTGCSGFLGSHLCKELKKSGWYVVGIDIKLNTNKYVDSMWYRDIRNQFNIVQVFQRHTIDVVFHLAGRIEVGESFKTPGEFFSVNTGGTANLIGVMEKFGVKNIVYSSTAAVYAAQDNPITENSPKNNNSPYGQSKWCAEQVIQNSNINYVIFRYFNLSGADPEGEFGENHEPETHLIPRIIQNMDNFTVYGDDYNTPDGSCIRDYVHVSDVAKAHVLAAEHIVSNNDTIVLNLGTGNGHSVFEIIDIVESVSKKNVKYGILPRRVGDPPCLVADISLAKKVLNFAPKHDILSIIKTSYDWYNK